MEPLPDSQTLIRSCNLQRKGLSPASESVEGAPRKRRRHSSSSSSSTDSSLAKVSRLTEDLRYRDPSDVEDSYENDDDGDDDDEDEPDEVEDEDEIEDELEDEDSKKLSHSRSPSKIPTEGNEPRQDVAGKRVPYRGSVRASIPVVGGGEKNGEKSTPLGTADLNAPRQHSVLHQHQQQQQQQQQQPASNCAHYYQQQQQRHKRPKYDYTRDQMFEIFQPWVIRTYGDRAKTKTITLKKQARIIKTLRGLEMNNPDSSKFRFWVKTKGFTTSKPGNFQDLFTHHNILENDGCVLFAPSGGLEPGQPYKKVAVVENFFDIIYGVHVSLESRATRHAGQKRTYRTITETYAFLPREAVTKFLSLCSQCSKLTTKVYSPKADLKVRSREDDANGDDTPANSTVCELARISTARGELAESKSASAANLRYYELLRSLYENGKSNGTRKDPTSCETLKRASGAEVKPENVRMSRSRSAASADASLAFGGVRGAMVVGGQSASDRGGFRDKSAVGLNNNCNEKVGEEKRKAKADGTRRDFGLEEDDALNMVSLFYYFYGFFTMQQLYNH